MARRITFNARSSFIKRSFLCSRAIKLDLQERELRKTLGRLLEISSEYKINCVKLIFLTRRRRRRRGRRITSVNRRRRGGRRRKDGKRNRRQKEGRRRREEKEEEEDLR